MDITLARTFLEIVASGSFLHAAERLHVTQTAVSARVRTLEELLGRRLFVRNRSGAVPTVAGEQFVRHATALVQVWERARQQVGVPAGRRALLTLGCETSLWELLLTDWLVQMRREAPDVALRTEVGFAADLLDRVWAGTLELAVLYAPQQRPGLRIDLLIEEKLVMVTSEASGRLPTPDEYIHVDWGPEFAAQHALAFPSLTAAGIATSLGPLGLGYLLAAGGAGYFRRAVVQPLVDVGRLFMVRGAPEFLHPAYAVYSASADADLLGPALAGLRAVAGRLAAPAPARRRRR